MHLLNIELRHGKILSSRSALVWRLAQLVVWLLGTALFLTLLIFPETGALLFWNVLIPVAPLLFVVALGSWRNTCPLAAVTLLPRHFGLSRQKKPTPSQAGFFSLLSVLAFYLIVPLRHPLFNLHGHATAMLLLALAAIGMGLGFVFEWKSAWCSGLCPIHPVEKLYGGQPFVSVPNTHCRSCMNCVIPCPDSTPSMNPLLARNNRLQNISGLLIAGGLPGFIWGWFQVPDRYGNATILNVANAYSLPLAGLLLSLAVFLFLKHILGKSNQGVLINGFAAASVTCYYWYRLPALIGFGVFPDDGALFHLAGIVPDWSVPVLRTAVVAFFSYWFMIRRSVGKSWTLRPAFDKK